MVMNCSLSNARVCKAAMDLLTDHFPVYIHTYLPGIQHLLTHPIELITFE